jgi:hypothetical protein
LAKVLKKAPLKPSLLLDVTIKILNKHLIQTIGKENTNAMQPLFNVKSFKPEIIISECLANET